MKTRAKRSLIASAVALATALGALIGIQTKEAPKPFYEIAATRDIAYQTVPNSTRSWGSANEMAFEMSETRVRLANHQGGSYRVKRKGDAEWSRLRNLSKTMDVFRGRLLNAPVGEVWLVRAEVDDFIVRGRKVDRNPAVISDAVEGTQAARIIWATVRYHFPDVRFMGLYVCKRIAGSYRLSQHSYGNAVDFGAPTKYAWGSSSAIAYIDRIVDFMNALDAKGYVPVSQVLWRGVANHYPGHVHFSGDPLLTGYSCGVRS